MSTKPQAGDRVKYSHPKVLKGKEILGKLEEDSFEGMTVFMPDEVHHASLVAAFFEPEAGLYLKGARIELV